MVAIRIRIRIATSCAVALFLFLRAVLPKTHETHFKISPAAESPFTVKTINCVHQIEHRKEAYRPAVSGSVIRIGTKINHLFNGPLPTFAEHFTQNPFGSFCAKLLTNR